MPLNLLTCPYVGYPTDMAVSPMYSVGRFQPWDRSPWCLVQCFTEGGGYPGRRRENASLNRNRILDGLSRREYARIAAHLSRVTLKFGLVLGEPGAVMHSAYFLETAVVSAFSLAQDGTSLEVSVVGNEGMVGVPIVLGSYGFPYRTAVQRSGNRLEDEGRCASEGVLSLRSVSPATLRYVHTLIVVLSQSSSLQSVSQLQQRLSRWLLESQDRAASGEMEFTQELLSQMLGVNRASANQAAAALQRAGFIRYRRGRITVLNRVGLEGAACECYRIVKSEVDRFFPT